ncbi:MAG: hypothetical protein JGK26_22660 [Microcoleus sp. PH2017_27_LUM_O_A]|nr:hypothetical protein [Microcoleus sp. PH2017_27_LUM_O_A]MCC3462157.1 hypothetical protein [Microcoleus sp. PH2017_11_PCY_U_A]MCC3561880.1 hypothetical protein [Microcoleus sp. PH2017_27_LUM_O_A]
MVKFVERKASQIFAVSEAGCKEVRAIAKSDSPSSKLSITIGFPEHR